MAKKAEQKKEDISVTICIPLHIYPISVVFSFNTEDKDLKQSLIRNQGFKKKDFRDKNHKIGRLTGGRWVYYRENLCGLIRMHTIPVTSRDWGILAHEICHMVSVICEQLGLSLQMGVSDEAYAYLTSYLTEEIYKALNKYY